MVRADGYSPNRAGRDQIPASGPRSDLILQLKRSWSKPHQALPVCIKQQNGWVGWSRKKDLGEMRRSKQIHILIGWEGIYQWHRILAFGCVRVDPAVGTIGESPISVE